MIHTDTRLEGDWGSGERLPDPAPGMKLFLTTYNSVGIPVKGYLVVPPGSEPLPGLVYCRGGIGRAGAVRIERVVDFARLGFAVFAPFYRGSGSGAGVDRFGGDDRHDVYAAVRLVHSLSFIREGPIPLVGFSRGSIMALLAARDCPGAGPAVVWGGVSDLLLTYEERVDLRRMLKRVVGHPVKDAEAYLERSPVHWAGAIRTPVMIIHGTADENVGVEHARRLDAALRGSGVETALCLFEGQEHVFDKENDRKALVRMAEWIRRQLSVRT